MYKFPYLTSREIRENQFKRIEKIIKLAFNHTDFYREKYSRLGIHPHDIKSWDDFYHLPTVSKDEIFEHSDECVVSYRKRDPKLMISKSSGSSGKVLDVVEDGNFWIHGALISTRMFQQAFKYSILDKQALIYTSEYPYSSILGFYKAKYLHTLTPIKEIIRFLLNYKPDVIVCYPSILLEVSQVLTQHDLSIIRPKAISTNSEYSSQSQRDYLSSVFQCPVFDEYSSEELSYIAYQCPYHNYHIQEDSSYIEILDTEKDEILPDGAEGEIVGTCLINEVMPFIRYRQGDLGTINNFSCECKNNGRVISSIAGRKNCCFKLDNGATISSGRLLDWTYELVLKQRLPIIQFQLVQKTLKDIELNVVCAKTFDPNSTRKIVEDSFNRNFSSHCNIQLHLVPSLEKTKAGKHLPIKSLI
jgi:phenylacetate-CoA ligase